MDDSEGVSPEDLRCLGEVIHEFEARRDEYVNLLEANPAAEPLAVEAVGPANKEAEENQMLAQKARAVWMDLHYPFYEPHHRRDEDDEVHRRMNAWRRAVFALVRKCYDQDDPVYRVVSQLTTFRPDHLHNADEVQESFNTRIRRLHALRVKVTAIASCAPDPGAEAHRSSGSETSHPTGAVVVTGTAQAPPPKTALPDVNDQRTEPSTTTTSQTSIPTRSEIIIAIKVKEGWTMDTLAHNVGVSRSTLFKFQAGLDVGKENLKRMNARLRALAPEGISTEILGAD